jgi:5-methylcytosine-specific restriction endonuclease McrA
MSKICSTCNEEKDFSCFFKNKNMKDGFSYSCKECIKQYKENNKDKINKTRRNYYKNNKDKFSIRQKKNYLKNREKIKLRNSKYYFLNKEKINSKHKEFRKANKESIILRNRVRKLKLKKTIKQLEIDKLLRNYNYCCYYCGINLKNEKMHLDHKIPLCKNGDHDILNLVPSCPSCNLRKGIKTEKEFTENLRNHVL